jgi:hypothetical protein
MSRPTGKTDISPRALEMIMRDVLEGMEELSLLAGYQADLAHNDIRLLLDQGLHRDNLIYFTPAPRRVA